MLSVVQHDSSLPKWKNEISKNSIPLSISFKEVVNIIINQLNVALLVIGTYVLFVVGNDEFHLRCIQLVNVYHLKIIDDVTSQDYLE